LIFKTRTSGVVLDESQQAHEIMEELFRWCTLIEV